MLGSRKLSAPCLQKADFCLRDNDGPRFRNSVATLSIAARFPDVPGWKPAPALAPPPSINVVNQTVGQRARLFPLAHNNRFSQSGRKQGRDQRDSESPRESVKSV